MLIYEKNNKLNINFENELDNPDIEIGKGEINVDGNNIVDGGGGSGGSFIVAISQDSDNSSRYNCDKTFKEIREAFFSGKSVIFDFSDYSEGQYYTVAYIEDREEHYSIWINYTGDMNVFSCEDENEYPDYTFQ